MEDMLKFEIIQDGSDIDDNEFVIDDVQCEEGYSHANGEIHCAKGYSFTK